MGREADTTDHTTSGDGSSGDGSSDGTSSGGTTDRPTGPTPPDEPPAPTGALATASHLFMVWALGTGIFLVLGQLLLLALWGGLSGRWLLVLAAAALVSCLPLASLGRAARGVVPLARTRRGLLAWTSGVFALGTAGTASLVALVWHGPNGAPALSTAFYALGGLPYALAAALFHPRRAVRATALTVATAVFGLTAYAGHEAARPPTDQEWLAEARTPAALLRVGDPPPGYTLRTGGATDTSYSATYLRAGHDDISLYVSLPGTGSGLAHLGNGQDCGTYPPETVTCTRDGAGRLFLSAPTTGLHELHLHRADLTLTVLFHTPADLPKARHILTTTHPITPNTLPPRRYPTP